jgi:hypothetical protein
MQVAFDPARDAFAFANTFGNRCNIARVPIHQTRGRCGGMVFAALDHWHAGVPVPPIDELPPDGEPLGDYIHDRMRTSLIDNWERSVLFMRLPDQWTPFNRRTLGRLVREEELPRLTELLDAGTPQPLALTQARSMDGLSGDHQVVAYGYEHDGPDTRILIWDNRYGRRPEVLTLRTAYDPKQPEIVGGDGQKWRGFFVERYTAKIPPYVRV